jgi:hypothetical protein
LIAPFDPEQEAFFFDVEIGAQLSRLSSARRGLGGTARPHRGSAGALREIAQATIALERSLHWYRKAREVAVGLGPVAPWPASRLPGVLRERVRGRRLGVTPPEGRARGHLTVPEEPLVMGLLGAALTMRAAGGKAPAWRIETAPGILFSALSLPGGERLLAPATLLRSHHWPGAGGSRSGCDAGLPYLAAVLGPFKGEIELIWKSGVWRLECAIPLAD